MTRLMSTRRMRPRVLRPTTAGDIMTANPLSFDRSTPIQKAAALLSLHGLDGAPVVDDFGRPVGIVTTSAYTAWEEFTRRSAPETYSLTRLDWAAVNEILCPNIELVALDTLSDAVIGRMIDRRARRVYVVNDAGKLVGVASTSDALRHLIDDDITTPVLREPAL